jgi:Tol biopolymer transport system component
LAILSLLALGCGGESPTDPGVQDGMPIVQAFSPTGAQADIDLFLFSVDGTRRRRLVGLPGIESSPQWSPDGKQVLFTRSIDQRAWVVNADGSAPHALLADTLGQPVWSPDGKWIAFHRRRPSEPEIWTARADGSDMRRLTPSADFGAYGPPSWSPDGRIAFMHSGSLWTVRADGTGLTILTTVPGDWQPSWSPDGSKLAFIHEAQSGESGPPQRVYVMNADGSGRRLVPVDDDVSADSNPTWSPDGQWILYDRIVFTRELGSRCYLYRVPAAGGSPVVVVADTVGTTCGVASWRR